MLFEDLQELQNCVLPSIEVPAVVPEFSGPQLGADMQVNTSSQHFHFMSMLQHNVPSASLHRRSTAEIGCA